MKRPIQWILLLILCCSQASTISFGDDDTDYAADALHPLNDIAWSKMFVRVLDPDGQPVKGVKVRPWALRAGNGHGAWSSERIGAPVTTHTDADGRAEVIFPVALDWGIEDGQQTVSSVSMFLSHDEFCSENFHVEVMGDDPQFVSELRLKRGFRLRVAGVAPGSDVPLSDCHILVEGQGGENEFEQQPDGWVRSVPLTEDRRWFRVVRTAPSEPPQFSRLQAWSPDDAASREVRVEVRPGVRVVGKVSENVPRPIKKGRVVVWCGSPARSEQDQPKHRRAAWWIDTVPIAEDGSFVFDSLPSGYLAQFYAIADDWISSPPTDEAFETSCKWFSEQNRERNQVFRYGQVLRLAKGETELSLEMERGGQMRVKCVDSEGNPLPRIFVTSWPNQYIVGGGSTVFCMRQSSLEGLRGKSTVDYERDNPFVAETDETGAALIRSVPPGQQSVYGGNVVWRSRQPVHAEVKSDQTSELTMTLQRSRK
jgi:hypothetical protein